MMRRLVYVILLTSLLLTPLPSKCQDPFSDFQSAIDSLTQKIMDILDTLKGAALSIGRVLAGTLIALGVVLWASDIFSYKGRRLIIAGIVLMIILELLS